MTYVKEVTVTVALSDGEQHTFVASTPGPQGSNPRFLAQQVAAGIDTLAARADRTMDIYGTQIRSA